MLRLANELKGFKLAATDDELGRVKDFLIDEEHWTVRYMVADTGRWIPHRKVLISPISLEQPDWDGKLFPVKLSKEEVKNQPELDTDAPVSRKYEKAWHEKYGYPYYYGAGTSMAWGYGIVPASMFEERRTDVELGEPGEPSDDRHLRSVAELRGYHVVSGGSTELGTVSDMVVDDETWAIRYLVVDTRKAIGGVDALLAPAWCGEIDWAGKTIPCDLPPEKVKTAPGFTPEVPINRNYEQQLHDFYGKDSYWSISGL